MAALAVGDVVLLFDATIRPPKSKWFVCVCVRKGWFLRINTKPIWKPHIPLQARVDRCLDRDCYVELRGVVEYDDSEIDASLRYPDHHKGRLTDDTLRRLLEAISTALTFTEEERTTIVQELKNMLGDRRA